MPERFLRIEPPAGRRDSRDARSQCARSARDFRSFGYFDFRLRRVSFHSVASAELNDAISEASLPTHASVWVRELLGEIPRGEPLSSCSDCAMLAPPGQAYDPEAGHFSPQTKCCTFMPRIPNFLVGELLMDRGRALTEGRRRMKSRIEARAAVTPLGVWETSREQVLLTTGDDGFGTAVALRCPFFDLEAGGHCSIWKYHVGYCSTWFCKHERGAVGWRFWTALRDFIKTGERALAHHCLVALDLPAESMAVVMQQTSMGPHRIRAAHLDAAESPSVRKRLWGPWLGREKEWYAACRKIVRDLSWKDVQRIGGPRFAMTAAIAREAYRKTKDTRLPDRLVARQFRVNSVQGSTTRVWTYSEYDPIDIPSALVGALEAFDGRLSSKAMASLRARGLTVDADTLRVLVDFGVLEEA